MGGTAQARRSRREGLPGAVAIVLAMTAACIAGAAALTLLRGADYESTATVRGAASPERARGAEVARRALDIAGARGEPGAALLDHSDVESAGAGLAFTVRADEADAARRLATGYGARTWSRCLSPHERAPCQPVPPSGPPTS